MNRRSLLRLVPLTPALFKPAISQDGVLRTAGFDGHRVRFESYGRGADAVVFVHGWTCDRTFWRRQAPVYGARRSLLIDLPGHGESDKPRIAYPVELFAASIRAVLDLEAIGRPVLVGHSLGGPIIYAFLRMYPGRARAIVLVDADVRPGSAGPINAAEQRERMARVAANMQGASGERAFARLVESCFTEKTPETVKAEVRGKMLATPKYVRIAAVTSPSSLPPPVKAESFTLPGIAIQAGSSGTESRFRAMTKLFPALELEKWDGNGHFLMMEEPDRFNRSLENFLARLA